MITHAQKTAILLAHARHKSPETIASELGITPEQVRSCLSRRRPRCASVIPPSERTKILREPGRNAVCMTRGKVRALVGR
jgi:hypothetical protein